MTPQQKEYQALLSLAQSYLLAEFKGKERLMTDPSTYQFFLHYAQSIAKERQREEPPPERERSKAPPAAMPPVPKAPPAAEERRPPLERECAAAPPPKKPEPAQPRERREEPPSEGAEKSSAGQRLQSPRRFNFKREPLKEVEGENLLQVRSEVEKLFPELPLAEGPPSDERAKRVGEEWKSGQALPEVVFLAFHESNDEKVFLQNVSSAVAKRLSPCTIYSAPAIEKQGAWERLFAMEKLRLIVATDYNIHLLPVAMRYYSESEEKRERRLGGIPLLLLPELSLYLKEPTLKAALWKALTATLQRA